MMQASNSEYARQIWDEEYNRIDRINRQENMTQSLGSIDDLVQLRRKIVPDEDLELFLNQPDWYDE